MFLNQAILKRIMKKAYKSGLIVGRNAQDWIYISDGWWEVCVNYRFIPKETLGDLISLVGELPEIGERFNATKDGNQVEVGFENKINTEAFAEQKELIQTDVLLVGNGGTLVRLFQDELKNTYAVSEIFVNIIDNSVIDEKNGEYAVHNPIFRENYGILYFNNVCMLRVFFRKEDRVMEIIKKLNGHSLTVEDKP